MVIDFFVSFMEGEEAKEVYELLNGFASTGDSFKNFRIWRIQFPKQQYNHFVFGGQVQLNIYHF